MLDGWNDLLQDDTILNCSKYLWLYKNIKNINIHIEKYSNNSDITDLVKNIKTLDKEILELQKSISVQYITQKS